MGQTGEPRFDPGVLSAAQCQGDACVVCHKKWPRPRVRAGLLPDGQGVFACDDCAPALPNPRGPQRPAEPARAGRPCTRRATAVMPVFD
ncbi:hypothetical protein GCM10023085_36480 [Actinomadura viridis]|uniref:Uncharacterized protein n=1 Tax=Actinomadura viridis TaxID=58110 RepID=A0A931DEQ1_9ACTN|nr:hypothetical protein [Actinomadura viridis]MBG6087817.1 hypothetical protein [Actinomadura viridis]